MQRGNGLQDKRVVVLGGSSGIGLAVAEQAASQGASVIIASSSAERVQKAVESIGGEAHGQAVDVSDERAVATFFSKLGTFDHLVFTAGDNLHLHDLAATDLQQARRAFELRYWAALAAVKYGSSHIRKEGSIVLTTGIAGQRPEKGWVIAASVCGTIEALTPMKVASRLLPAAASTYCRNCLFLGFESFVLKCQLAECRTPSHLLTNSATVTPQYRNSFLPEFGRPPGTPPVISPRLLQLCVVTRR